MTKTKTLGILAGILTAAATYTGAARAEGTGYGSVGALVGFGFVTSSYSGDINPVGLGLGVRGGYTLPMNLYLGGTFVYHLGGSQSFPGGEVSAHVMYFGFEGGYDIEAGPVIVRPYLGLGDIIATVSAPPVCVGGLGCVDLGSTSSGAFALWPGAAVLYPIDNFFVGGDARFVLATGNNSDFNEISIFATGGLKF